MRTTTILLATLILTSTLLLCVQNANQQGTTTTASSDSHTLEGCLKGSKHRYYIVEQDGTHHTVMEKGQDLSSYVNHKVTLTGKADTSRKAGASSDVEHHRRGFFSVDSVSDQGTCKK